MDFVKKYILPEGTQYIIKKRLLESSGRQLLRTYEGG